MPHSLHVSHGSTGMAAVIMSVSLYKIQMCGTCVVFAVPWWTNTDHRMNILTTAEKGLSLYLLYQNSIPVLMYFCFDCHLSVAGGWMWKRVCVFVHWLSSMKEDLQMSRTILSSAGNLRLHKNHSSIIIWRWSTGNALCLNCELKHLSIRIYIHKIR